MMPAFLMNPETLFALSGACVALLATPSTPTSSRRQRKSPGFCVIAIALALFGGALVHAAKEAAQGPYTVNLRRQQIPLHSANGVVVHKSAYYGQVAVGGPEGQHFEVVFDTGSGHLVLPSTMCHSDTCKKHRRYRRRQSLLATDIDFDGTPVPPGQARDQITVSFGTGEVTGVFVEDHVCLGQPEQPAKDAPSTATLIQQAQQRVAADKSQYLNEDGTVDKKAQAAAVLEMAKSLARAAKGTEPLPGCVDLRLVAATEMSEEPFGSFEFDGVLGLGLDGLTQAPEFHFLNMAANAGAWTAMPGFERTFAVFLADTDEEQSEITFGGWSDARTGGVEPAWNTVRNPQLGYWQLDVVEVRANGVVIDYCAEGCRAVVDTGTSLLGVPSALAPLLQRHLVHSAAEGGDCGGPGPALEIVLENFTVRLDPTDISRPDYERTAKTADAAVDAQPASEPTSCVPMLMFIDLPPPLGPKLLVLGEPVLQRYYTAFDGGDVPRVGFTQALHKSPRKAARIFE